MKCNYVVSVYIRLLQVSNLALRFICELL